MHLPMPVLIVVVLDACDDGSDHLAGQFGPNVHFVSIDAGNVGAARAAGFEYARSVCTDVEPARIWFATTDADTIVGSRVAVTDDRGRRRHGARHGADTGLAATRRGRPPLPGRLQLERPGHNHVHGANMGFRADAYWERRRLPRAEHRRGRRPRRRFESAHMRIHRDAKLSVATSARRRGPRTRRLRRASARTSSRRAGARQARRHDRRIDRQWLDSGALDLPLPGGGDTAQRWRRLAELPRSTSSRRRLAEAHADAVAILAELGGPEPKPGRLWGVWAAESRDAVLSAHGDGDAVTLDGTKAWCSGAGLCTHALVTADSTPVSAACSPSI